MKQLLVIDDNPTDVHLLRMAFEEARSQTVVEHALDGAEALELLKKRNGTRPPDLILLDLHLPRLCGFEILELLNADPRFRRIPVVVWSSSSRTEDIEKSYALGAASYIVKGVGLNDVLVSAAAIDRTLQQPPAG